MGDDTRLQHLMEPGETPKIDTVREVFKEEDDTVREEPPPLKTDEDDSTDD